MHINIFATYCLTICLILGSQHSTASTIELSVNGGFSSGDFDHWTVLDATPGPGKPAVGQILDIAFKYRGFQVRDAGFFAEIFADLSTTPNYHHSERSPAGLQTYPNADSGVHLQLRLDTPMPQLVSLCGAESGCLSDYYLDNFMLSAAIPTGVVPIPAAIWLFGTGLIGLCGIAGFNRQRRFTSRTA